MVGGYVPKIPLQIGAGQSVSVFNERTTRKYCTIVYMTAKL